MRGQPQPWIIDSMPLAGWSRRKETTMPSLLPSRWSTLARIPASVDVAASDDDLAIGWEAACPALQLEGWEPAPATPAKLDPSLN